MIYPNVSIIILNYNGWKDTIECLESIFQIDYPNFNVIVVDNNSTDDSIKKLYEYANGQIKTSSAFFEYNISNKPLEIIEFSKDFEISNFKIYKKKIAIKNFILIKNNRNCGFAEGNNIGISCALKTGFPDYILLLNNDTIVKKDFLTKLIKKGDTNPNIGIIGPKVYYYDEPNRLQVAGGKINFWTGKSILRGDREIDNGQYNKTEETDFISGCCFLFKKELIDKIGFLNSFYRCYWEEVDYCLSSKEKGYLTIYFPISSIWHKGSRSTNKNKGLMTYYMTRNMFWFMKKHTNIIQLISFLVYFFLFRFWYINTNFLLRKKNKDIKMFWKAIAKGIVYSH